MPQELRYDELTSHIGQVFGPTPPVALPQSVIDAFAETTGDHQWVHVDVARANREVGGTIAHGYLVLALIPRFTAQLITFTGVGYGLNYGLNKVRFTAPAPAGSIIAATQKIISVEAKSSGALITSEVVIKAVGADRPTCIAETLVLVFPGNGRL